MNLAYSLNPVCSKFFSNSEYLKQPEFEISSFYFTYHGQSHQGECMGGSRGGTGGPDPPEKSQKSIGFLCNTGTDPLKNYKAIKPAFSVGPISAHQRNTISTAFCWQANDGPFIYSGI